MNYFIMAIFFHKCTKINRRPPYGVSTPEILLAVAIILSLTALALINWSSAASNRRLQAGAMELAADLRYARQTAMNEGGAVLDITVFPQGSTTGYTVKNNTGITIRQTALQGLLVTLPGGAPSVSCTQSGTFSIGGSAILTDPVTNRTAAVTLVQRTGMVSVP